MSDFIDEAIRSAQVSGSTRGEMESAGMEHMDREIGALVSAGAIDEVGAHRLRRALRQAGSVTSGLPSPAFERSSRDTERRGPSGFTEDGTGKFFFTLAAVIGSSTVMRSKVSRVVHVDRLLIVPSLPGAIITSIKVGDEEQVLSAGAPVELYSSPALTDTLPDNFSPLSAALDFIVTLFNTTAVAITGTIGFKGDCKR